MRVSTQVTPVSVVNSNDTTPIEQKNRLHHLDALRALALLNVVVAHAAMSFAVKAPSGWAALDRSRNIVFDLMIFIVSGFTMQLFFFLSGFFSLMVIQKKGLGQFTRSRWQRIVVPFLLSVVTIWPILQVVGIYGTYTKTGADQSKSFWFTVTDYFTNGINFSNLNLGHLWFLLYLTLVSVALVLTLFMSKRFHVSGYFKSIGKMIIKMPAKPLLLAIPTAGLMLLMDWMIDTPSKVLPEWDIVAYYSFFFFLGAIFCLQKEKLTQPQKTWKICLASALLLAFPATAGLVLMSSYAPNMRSSPYYFGAILTFAFFTWLMIFGLIGLFQKRFSKPLGYISYLSEASFWIYLAHFPLVLLLQVFVMHLQLPVILKFFLVLSGSMAVLLGSYELFVRRTFLGKILNGKVPPKKQSANKQLELYQ